MKTIEQYFFDWESYVFGYGYGTGDEHTLGALKTFLSSFKETNYGVWTYRHEELEAACGPAVAWLLINKLCPIHVIDYGCSSRGGWLTPEGVALRDYVCSKTLEELLEAGEKVGDLQQEGNYYACFPDHCNCLPKKPKCVNPFWSPSLENHHFAQR